jgi:hypothetical protein
MCVSKTTLKRQVMPHLYNGRKLIGSLCLTVGRKTFRPCFRTSGLSTFNIADNQAVQISGMQEYKNAAMQEC